MSPEEKAEILKELQPPTKFFLICWEDSEDFWVVRTIDKRNRADAVAYLQEHAGIIADAIEEETGKPPKYKLENIDDLLDWRYVMNVDDLHFALIEATKEVGIACQVFASEIQKESKFKHQFDDLLEHFDPDCD